MDAYYFECRFNRCSRLWKAARGFRNFRTYWQDQDARRPINRIRGFLCSLRAA